MTTTNGSNYSDQQILNAWKSLMGNNTYNTSNGPINASSSPSAIVQALKDMTFITPSGILNSRIVNQNQNSGMYDALNTSSNASPTTAEFTKDQIWSKIQSVYGNVPQVNYGPGLSISSSSTAQQMLDWLNNTSNYSGTNASQLLGVSNPKVSTTAGKYDNLSQTYGNEPVGATKYWYRNINGVPTYQTTYGTVNDAGLVQGGMQQISQADYARGIEANINKMQGYLDNPGTFTTGQTPSASQVQTWKDELNQITSGAGKYATGAKDQATIDFFNPKPMDTTGMVEIEKGKWVPAGSAAIANQANPTPATGTATQTNTGLNQSASSLAVNPTSNVASNTTTSSPSSMGVTAQAPYITNQAQTSTNSIPSNQANQSTNYNMGSVNLNTGVSTPSTSTPSTNTNTNTTVTSPSGTKVNDPVLAGFNQSMVNGNTQQAQTYNNPTQTPQTGTPYTASPTVNTTGQVQTGAPGSGNNGLSNASNPQYTNPTQGVPYQTGPITGGTTNNTSTGALNSPSGSSNVNTYNPTTNTNQAPSNQNMSYGGLIQGLLQQTQMTPAELALRNQQTNVTNALNTGVANEQNNPIPLEFQTGRIGVLRNLASQQQETLAQQVANMVEQRRIAAEAYGKAVGATAPIQVSPGTSVVSPTTGSELYSGTGGYTGYQNLQQANSYAQQAQAAQQAGANMDNMNASISQFLQQHPELNSGGSSLVNQAINNIFKVTGTESPAQIALAAQIQGLQSAVQQYLGSRGYTPTNSSLMNNLVSGGITLAQLQGLAEGMKADINAYINSLNSTAQNYTNNGRNLPLGQTQQINPVSSSASTNALGNINQNTTGALGNLLNSGLSGLNSWFYQ